MSAASKYTCLVLVASATCFCPATGARELFRVDLGCPGNGSTLKPGWVPWELYDGCDGQPHEGRGIRNIAGTAIDVYISTLNDLGHHNLRPSIGEPIANTAYYSEYTGHPDASIQLDFSGPGLVAGSYELLSYHNGPVFGNMPSVNATGAAVTAVQPAYNVAVQYTNSDNELVASKVRFSVDGSGPASVIYEAAPGSTACVNAFILDYVEPSVEFEQGSSEVLEIAQHTDLPVILSNEEAGATYSVGYKVTGGTTTHGIDYDLPGYCWCDLDGSGIIDLADIGILLDYWLQEPAQFMVDAGSDGNSNFDDFSRCAAEHYLPCIPPRLVFMPGQTIKNIPVDIFDDGIAEEAETATIRLSNPGQGLSLDRTAEHTVTILDLRPEVSFETASSSGPENATAQIPVVLSHAVPQTVTVDYAVTGGTATGDRVDYLLVGGTLTFEPGTDRKEIFIRIVDDTLKEQLETIELGISNPQGSGAVLGAFTNHVYTIIDNEAGVFWDGKFWYYSSRPLEIFVNGDGDFEWSVDKGEQFITRIPEQRLSQTGDVVEVSYIWMTDGSHNCPDCFDCDLYCHDDDITCIAGTSDIRVGLFEADGEYVDDDGLGIYNNIFENYKGYNFRFGPNMVAGPNRWVDCTGEVHKTGMFGKKPPEDSSLMVVNDGLMDYIDGFELPPGDYSLFVLRLERLSSGSVRLSMTLNGRTQTDVDNSSSGQPQKIDVLAVYMRNGRPYNRLVLRQINYSSQQATE